uniref:Uncharacterized protein n=1 Tax=Tetranychus urticae TaxID=32264 RepID=T1KWR2_TETUR
MSSRALYQILARAASTYIMSSWAYGRANTSGQRLVRQYCRTMLRLCLIREHAYKTAEQGNRRLARRYLRKCKNANVEDTPNKNIITPEKMLLKVKTMVCLW